MRVVEYEMGLSKPPQSLLRTIHSGRGWDLTPPIKKRAMPKPAGRNRHVRCGHIHRVRLPCQFQARALIGDAARNCSKTATESLLPTELKSNISEYINPTKFCSFRCLFVSDDTVLFESGCCLILCAEKPRAGTIPDFSYGLVDAFFPLQQTAATIPPPAAATSTPATIALV